MAMLASYALLCENKKYPATKCYNSEHWTQDLSHLDLMLSSLTHQGMCYIEDIRSSYVYALLVLTNSNKVQDWSGKDIPNITGLTTTERRALGLNGWGLRFNAHWGKILLLFFSFSFNVVKLLLSI